MDPKKDLFLFSVYNQYKDQLITVMKDVESGEKSFNIINKPKIPIYFTKEKQDIYREYVNRDEVTEHMVSYKWREFEIARMTGNEDFGENVKNGLIRAETVHLNKNLYASDLDIRDYMIYRYMDSFDYTTDEKTGYKTYNSVPPIKNLHIGYLDIETNIMISTDREKQPIYLITYIDAKHNVCYTYYLYNKEFKDIDLLETQRQKVIQKLIDGVEEDITNCTISDEEKRAIIQRIMRERMSKMQFIVKRFDDEKSFLIDMWQLIIRKYQPDYLLIYNAEYDISQTMMRAEHFKIPLKELFCIPEIEAFIKFDMPQGKFTPSEKKHNYDATSLTKIIDSMILYFTRRKTSNFNAYSLDSVAANELGMRKLGYGHICSHIGELPYEDFITTYLYNVRDVLLMVFLEDVLNDIKYLISTRFLNRTEYDRVFTPMIAVTNSFWHIASRNNKLYPPTSKNRILAKIPNDALRILKEKDPHTYALCMALKNKKKIEGGLCSDPTKFKGEGRKSLYSFIETDVMEDICDEDAKSMYPNALSSSYIAMSTLYGMLYKIDEYDLTEIEVNAIMVAIEELDWIAVCASFFGLPSMKDVLDFLGYNYNEPKPKEYKSHTLAYLYDRCSKHRFDNISYILKNIFKPVQTEKDVENDDVIKLRNIFKITNDVVSQQSYFGTMLEYSIIHKETNNVISGMDYIQADSAISKYGNICIDASKKDTAQGGLDNSLLEFIEPKREPLTRREMVVSDFNLKEYTAQFHKENERNIRMNVNGYNVDLSSRLLCFNSTLINDVIDLNLGSKKDTTVYIHNRAPIIIKFKSKTSVEVTSNKQINLLQHFNITDDRITSKAGIDFISPFTIKIMNDDKVQNIKFIPVDITCDIYKLDIPESNDVIEAVIKYTYPLDTDHLISFSHRLYCIQYGFEEAELNAS